MTKLPIASALLLACPSLAVAQNTHPAVGTWQVAGLGREGRPWFLVLETVGKEVAGTVSSCGSNQGVTTPSQITSGHVAGNALTFTCSNFERTEVVTFTGTVDGDAMALVWKRTRTDRVPTTEFTADPTGMFGSSSPLSVVATRVRTGGRELAGAVNLFAKRLKAEGALFLPRDVARLRAILVLINSGTSWNGLAATVYTDAEMRALASRVQAGLLLLRVTPLDVGGHMYFVNNATTGGDDALLLLLDRLAADSGRPELREAPLLFWGHSASGPFGLTFALEHADRTIGVVGYHSGFAAIATKMDALRRLPVLFLQAGADVARNQAAFTRMSGEWSRSRAAGAPWTFGVEPDAVHQDPADVKKANAVVIPWIAAVLELRLPSKGGALRRVIADAGVDSWFPDDATRRGWAEITRR